jgi:hypothetical protein
MRLCFDASVIGTQKHLVYDGSYEWSASIPRDAWHFSGELKTSPTARCADTLLRLIGHKTASLPDKYVKSMELLLSGSKATIPWQQVVPQDVFKNYFQNLIDGTVAEYSRLPCDYYEAAWTAGSRVLGSLKSAKIDLERYKSFVDGDVATLPAVESFRPGKTGYASPVVYDRFGTRTGRLTVSSGPNILVLRKDQRSFIKSVFPDGAICSLDFKALEPRIVLAEAGVDLPDGDLYDGLNNLLFEGKVDRTAIKTAIISELYGASKSSLGLRLGIHGDKLDAFVSTIRRCFQTPQLKARLKEDLKVEGFVRNKHGRPLRLDPDADNLLVNTFTQSTGVDVAMLGFDSVLNRLGDDGVRPLFVLHDALILDVRGDRLADVAAIGSVAVKGYVTPFPIKFERM